MTHRNAPLLALAALFCLPSAAAEVPFVVLEDDGSVQDTPFDSNANANTVINALLTGYEDTGAELPDVISIWTAFPFNNNTIETRFIPIANDVTGIGLEQAYGVGQEVFALYPPVRAMLIHNDVTALAERASFERVEIDAPAFGRYLFLLELTHLWGPELQLAAPTPGRLIGFDFHWSFFLDAGGSPAGGNVWTDNGDGTFTAPPAPYAALTYAPLDLYLMGLASADDVAPFGLIHPTSVPSDAIDAFTHRTVNGASFPWPGPEPLTVEGTREVVTIDDVIAANGSRSPAFGAAPTAMTLGIVLVVPSGVTTEARDGLARDFVPLAGSLADAFTQATGNRGTLTVVTASDPPPPLPEPEPAQQADAGPDEAPAAPAGCGSTAQVSGAPLALACVLVCAGRVRRRAVSASA